MTPHEWKVLAVFGAFAGALSLFDGKAALYMVGLAGLIVVVRNSDQLKHFA